MDNILEMNPNKKSKNPAEVGAKLNADQAQDSQAPKYDMNNTTPLVCECGSENFIVSYKIQKNI